MRQPPPKRPCIIEVPNINLKKCCSGKLQKKGPTMLSGGIRRVWQGMNATLRQGKSQQQSGVLPRVVLRSSIHVFTDRNELPQAGWEVVPWDVG